MKLLKAVCGGMLIAWLLGSSPSQCSIGLNGGNGLTYIKSAWNLKPGYLTLYGRTRFFGQVATHEQAKAVTYWDVQGAFSINYGISDHIELAISPIMYQDNHKSGSGYNLPDDLFLGLKFGSYNLKGTSLTWAVSLDSRFPTAKYHNVPFEPYSAGTIEWGFTGMLTYSRDPLYPEDNLNIHANWGYVNHNDVGQKLSQSLDISITDVSVTNMSQQFLYGIGMKIPSSEFDFSIELYGNKFLQQPPGAAFSLEDYLYLTPGINYRAYKWLTLSFATDLRLSPDKDESQVKFYSSKLPNYPSWRVNLGMNIILLPTSVYRLSDKDILMRKAESRRELFEQIIKEQRETESAEEELERIKEERRKAERELERLRRILEGDLKKKNEGENK